MTKNLPIVSVVIPWKEREELLLETINSLRKQSLQAWEAIFVHDGGGTTSDAIQTNQSNDARFSFINRTREPSGASTCRNIGVKSSSGRYVVFLDSDDVLDPSSLECRVRVMEENPELDFAVFLTEVFNKIPGDIGRLWNSFTEKDDLDRFLLSDQPWHTSGPIWKRTALESIGDWDESCLSAQDWEFHIRSLTLNLKYAKFPIVTSFWRVTKDGSITSKWNQDTKKLNRIVTIQKISKILLDRGFFTENRRRMLSYLCYKEAFSNTDFSLAFRIWNCSKKNFLIRINEYILLLLADSLNRTVRKFNYMLVSSFFPESQRGTTHLKNKIEKI